MRGKQRWHPPGNSTLKELKNFNGEEGGRVYIGHEGKVYDVSDSSLWKTGLHMRRHQAGADLTQEIKAAPHDPEVLERFPQVGILRPEKEPLDEGVPDFLLRIVGRVPMLRRHPHPMTVHFPIAFMMLVPVFNVLFLLTGNAGFETSAFYVLAAGLVSTPVAMLTGPYNWWLNYGARWTYVIVVKVGGSLLLLTLIVCVFSCGE